MGLKESFKSGIKGDIGGKYKAHTKALKKLSPDAPKPTDAEIELENRQREELARLNDEENVRLKRGMRGRLGNRMLSSRPRQAARNGTVGGGAAGGAAPTVRVPRQPGGQSAY